MISKRLTLHRAPHDLSSGIALHVSYATHLGMLRHVHSGVDVAVAHGGRSRLRTAAADALLDVRIGSESDWLGLVFHTAAKLLRAWLTLVCSLATFRLHRRLP